jgi:hypothetical protein
MAELKKSLRFGTKHHQFIRDAVWKRKMFSEDKMRNRYERWRQDEEAFIFYMPEKDHDVTRRVLRDSGGQPQYTTLKIPYDYGVLMAAHTYWTSVFLGRDPVFQYAGREGQSQDATMAMEALINHQVVAGRGIPPLYIWLLDVGKYGVGIVGDFWDEETNVCTKIVDVPDEYLGIQLGTFTKELRRVLVKGFQGNRLYNVRPYDFYPDPRVTMLNLQDGEFCGRKVPVGWNQILKRAAAGKYFNIEYLRKWRARSTTSYEEGSSQVERPVRPGDETYMEAMDMSHVELIEMYVEVIPKQWKLGDSTYPEIWVFTLANEDIIIGAQPLGLYHSKFPFSTLELEPDGYAMFKRSLLEIAKPMTDVITWLVNTHFYNTRKALNDMFIVDPSRVVMKDVLDPSPGKIIRMKEEFFGQDIRTAIQQFPTSNVTQAHMADVQSVAGMLQRITGVNDALMGMANQKGRQTATEIRTSSTFGVNRLKTTAEWFSATGFTDLSYMLVANSQQLYDTPMKVRIAGDMWNYKGGQRHLEVTPDDIAGAWDFVPVDGTLPIDRFAQVNMWTQLLQQMAQSPQVLQSFDMGRIFSWVAQLGGLKNVNQFKIEMGDPMALQQQAAAGNVVPINGNESGRPGGNTTASGGTPVPSQVPAVGPSG